MCIKWWALLFKKIWYGIVFAPYTETEFEYEMLKCSVVSIRHGFLIAYLFSSVISRIPKWIYYVYAPEKRPRCFMMDQVLPSHSSSSGLLEPDSEEFQLRVDFFRKLGYSSAEVKSALRKLGLCTDTNAVLGELVSSRTSSPPCMSSPDNDERSIGQKDPLLPPSWTTAPRISLQHGDRKNTDTELRPIVVDGSNVAMR